jgi:hypothetical protein
VTLFLLDIKDQRAYLSQLIQAWLPVQKDHPEAADTKFFLAP